MYEWLSVLYKVNNGKRNVLMFSLFTLSIYRPWTMHTSSGDDEASKDPRIIGDQDFSQQYTENDFEGKSTNGI